MGSFKATGDFDGLEVDIRYLNYRLMRETDMNGRVTSRVKGGKIVVRVDSTSNTDLVEKMVNKQFAPFSGKITFLKTDEDGELKTLAFNNAFVVDFTESFDATKEEPMSTLVTLTAEEISIGNMSHKNEWPRG